VIVWMFNSFIIIFNIYKIYKTNKNFI